MTYPTQPGQPGGWHDPSWPSPEPYNDPAAQASPAAYDPYSAPPNYSQPQYAPPPAYMPQPQPYQAFAAPRPTNGMAIASFICSILGLFTCGVTSIVGAILGHVAKKQIAERGEGGDGFALAGIIVGWIVVVLTVLVVLMYLGLFAWILGNADTTTSQTDSSEWGGILRTAFAAFA